MDGSIESIVLDGFGNGTFDGSPGLITTMGFGIGEVPTGSLVGVWSNVLEISVGHRGRGSHTHTRMLGDTFEGLNAIIYSGAQPIDLSVYPVQFQMEDNGGTAVISESDDGITRHPTQIFTLDTENNWITCNSHGFDVDKVWVPITDGSLSGTGLTAGQRYRIVERDGDWFKVSLRSRGAPVTIADEGTGVHAGYIVGSVQKIFEAADVDTEGRYRGWFTVYDDPDRSTAPASEEGITVEVLPFGN